MFCTRHPNESASGACVGCGNFFCAFCLTDVGRKKYCGECVSELLTQKDRELERERDRAVRSPQNIVVTATGGGGGSSSSSSSAMAANGAHAMQSYGAPGASKMVAALVAIFLPFGIHRFMLGYSGIGILQLIATLACGVGILWCWIDALMIFSGSLRMADGRPLS